MGGLALLSKFYSPSISAEEVVRSGFRLGAKGTHTSRTIMFPELSATLDMTPSTASRDEYAAAIIDANCLGKSTAATRRLTNQRLGELYALDPEVPLFRVLRRLWEGDEAGRPLLALQCALTRDPLLAATAAPITERTTTGTWAALTSRIRAKTFLTAKATTQTNSTAAGPTPKPAKPATRQSPPATTPTRARSITNPAIGFCRAQFPRQFSFFFSTRTY